MPLRDDDEALEPIDDLLALDRKSIAGAANERIAGGMYARIARAHAERSSVAARSWQWQLLFAAVACAVLVAVWFALPRKNALSVVPQRTQLPVAPPSHARIATQPPMKTAPARAHGHVSSRSHVATLREEGPRQATFPSNVVPTEQEILLSRLAAQHPEELRAMAAAMADARKQEEKDKQEFDRWLEQKGGTQ